MRQYAWIGPCRFRNLGALLAFGCLGRGGLLGHLALRGRALGGLCAALPDGVPRRVTTCTLPLVAPTGTVVVMSDGETTVKTAAVPLKVTRVAPVKSVPQKVGPPEL